MRPTWNCPCCPCSCLNTFLMVREITKRVEHFCCLLYFHDFSFLESSRISFGKLPRLVLLVFDALLMRPALFEHLRFVKYRTYLMVLSVLIQIDFLLVLITCWPWGKVGVCCSIVGSGLIWSGSGSCFPGFSGFGFYPKSRPTKYR